jgi:predicted transcriptional regulator
MTPQDLSATLSRLGISQADAARLLGVTPTAVTRWVQGKRKVPGPVARLLGVLDVQKCAEPQNQSVRRWLELFFASP